jgi:uncharacterized membrane protein (UPF0127 family)
MRPSLFLGLLGCACAGRHTLPTTTLVIGEQRIRVEVADDMDERAQGLMFRDSMGADHGMLFVYPDVRPRSFWMENTTIPLSIAFIDDGGTVFRIRDMRPLDRDHTNSGLPARYALEMNRGWFGEHGITEGAAVKGLPGPSRE